VRVIDAHEVRSLLLDAPSAPGRPAHFSAASGLVRRGDWLYVVGDDENHLGVFRNQSDAPGRLVPLFEGALPQEHAARKAAKPDLEALTMLPPFGAHEHGALLALGSGSTPARERGVMWALGEDGGLRGEPVVLALGPLYAALRPHVAELNVEGACVSGGRLALLQRGNSETGDNLVVSLALDAVTEHLGRGAATLEASDIEDVRAYDLGLQGDVGLGFTDADALPDGRIVFTAAAEDTSNPYDDGVVQGSSVGVLSAAGELEWIAPIAGDGLKVEGVDAVLADGLIHVLMVCDADDPAVPSPLLSATLPA